MPGTPLQNINPNIQKRKKLTPYTCGQIVSKHDAEGSQYAIADYYKKSQATIQSTLKINFEGENEKSLPRSDRSSKLSDRDKGHIMILIKGDSFLTFRAICERIEIAMCRDTLGKVIKESEYEQWSVKKGSKLGPEHVKLRYQGALERKDWTGNEGKKMMGSDECLVELSKEERCQGAFQPNKNDEKGKKKYIMPYNKSKGTFLMIGAVFGGTEQSNIIALSRDFESKKHEYSVNSYIKLLNENLLDLGTEDLEFMQDNTSIHTAHAVKNGFHDKRIPLFIGPLYSSDLNPIEHVWVKLKEIIYELNSLLQRLTGFEEEKEAKMLALIREVGSRIGRDYLDSLIKSMNTRVNAVLEADEGYTRFGCIFKSILR